jgi:hypothetical protein
MNFPNASMGHLIAQVIVCQLPTAAAHVQSRVRSFGIVVDRVALGQVFFEYFCFPYQFSFSQLLHTWAGTVGLPVAGIASGLGVTLPHGLKNLNKIII